MYLGQDSDNCNTIKTCHLSKRKRLEFARKLDEDEFDEVWPQDKSHLWDLYDAAVLQFGVLDSKQDLTHRSMIMADLRTLYESADQSFY